MRETSRLKKDECASQLCRAPTRGDARPHQQDALPRLHGAHVHLEAVGAVLEVVLLGNNGAWQRRERRPAMRDVGSWTAPRD